ncbi:hypothetical protein ACVW0Z_002479 [Ewingella americana]
MTKNKITRGTKEVPRGLLVASFNTYLFMSGNLQTD